MKKLLSIVIATILMLTFSVGALAAPNSVPMLVNANDIVDSLRVNYELDGDTIIETTTFIDVDSLRVDMWRSIETDGTGKLIVNKSQESSTTILSNQDYDLFLKLVETKSFPITKGSTIGKDLVGSQYKHIYIASQSATINNSAIDQISAGGAGTAASIIIGYINPPAGVAVAIGAFMYSSILALSPSKMIIDQTVNEVHFSYDNVYYTHCYHEIMKSYDSGGHLIDTTRMYKQAVGG